MPAWRRPIVACATLLLVAAGPASAAEQERISIGSASVGGAFYVTARGLARLWKDVGQTPSVETTGGSVHNCSLLHRREVLSAVISQGAMWQAWHSVGLFKRQERHTNVRAVIPLDIAYMHGWARPGSGIAAYRDLAGRNVSGGPGGSTSDAWLRQMASAIVAPAPRYVTANLADTIGLLRDGRIEAASASGGIPIDTATEAASTLKARVFGLSYREDVDRSVQALPFMQAAELPARTYPGQDEPILTVADWNVYFVHKDMDESLVYAFTRMAFESRAAMAAMFPGLRALQGENVKNILLPLHRGAYRYYQERGIPVAEAAKPVD
jgi:TRAP transporter TAXI family solute receptor